MDIFDQIDIFSDDYDLSPFNVSCTIKVPKTIFSIFEKIVKMQYFYIKEFGKK